MRPVINSFALAAAVVGAVAAAQTTAGAGNLVINGSLASGGVAKMLTQQMVGLTSAGNDSAITFKITGTDGQNRVISESLAGPNANTVNSVFSYKTITSIAVSAAVGTNVTVDTINQGAGPEVPVDQNLDPGNISIAVEVTGAVTYTVEWTQDDVFAAAPGPFVWFPAAGNLVAATTTQAGAIVSPISAVRARVTAGQGIVNLIVRQSGALS